MVERFSDYLFGSSGSVVVSVDCGTEFGGEDNPVSVAAAFRAHTVMALTSPVSRHYAAIGAWPWR